MVPEQLTGQSGLETKIMSMIGGKTKLIGLLGQPVSHSISPVIHNAALAAMDLDWCYIGLPCDRQDLNTVCKALKALNFQGLNVTIPHKEKARDICDTTSSLAKRVGAVNTLVPNTQGGWHGTNTDVEGFLSPLKEKKLKGENAVVLGSGGSARAVVAGLQDLNLQQICIVSRNKKKLQSLIEQLNQQPLNNSNSKRTTLKGALENNIELHELINNAGLIINTTPVGMNTNPQPTNIADLIPFGEKIWNESLTPSTILYDLIYTPRPTEWLKLGAKVGCQQIDGLEMLIQQGAASLKLWCGIKEIPIEIMRRAAKRSLSI